MSEAKRKKSVRKTWHPKFPDHCTHCGHKFEKGEGGFPLPPKQFLCSKCFGPALNVGISNLNQTIAQRGLDLSIEEIAGSFKEEVSGKESK